MKRLIVTLIALFVTLSAFIVTPASAGTFIRGRYYPDYGLVNEGAQRRPTICYDISLGSVIVGALFAPTVIVPAYIIGWHLMKPVRKLGRNDYCYSPL